MGVDDDLRDEPLVTVALVAVDGDGLAPDQLGEPPAGPGAVGLTTLGGVDACKTDALWCGTRIKDLDGVAVDDADDAPFEAQSLCDDGFGEQGEQ